MHERARGSDRGLEGGAGREGTCSMRVQGCPRMTARLHLTQTRAPHTDLLLQCCNTRVGALRVCNEQLQFACSRHRILLVSRAQLEQFRLCRVLRTHVCVFSLVVLHQINVKLARCAGTNERAPKRGSLVLRLAKLRCHGHLLVLQLVLFVHKLPLEHSLSLSHATLWC